MSADLQPLSCRLSSPLSPPDPQVVAVGSGIKKHPLFFLDFILKRGKKKTLTSSLSRTESRGDGSKTAEKKDVMQEVRVVSYDGVVGGTTVSHSQAGGRYGLIGLRGVLEANKS